MKSIFKSKRLLIVVIIILIILITAITAREVNSKIKSSKISQSLKLGEKYLTELQYEDAIVEFQKVIKIEPRNVDAYIGIADAYIAQKKTDEAEDWLVKGITEIETAGEVIDGCEELYIKASEIKQEMKLWDWALGYLKRGYSFTSLEVFKDLIKDVENKQEESQRTEVEQETEESQRTEVEQETEKTQVTEDVNISEEAKKAYKKFFTSDTLILYNTTFSFQDFLSRYINNGGSYTLYDIDNNGIPEAILNNCDYLFGEQCTQIVFTYKDNSVVEVLESSHGEIYFYEGRNIIKMDGVAMGEFNIYYAFNNFKFEEKARYEQNGETGENYYYISERQVSKVEYGAYIDELTGGAQSTNVGEEIKIADIL